MDVYKDIFRFYHTRNIRVWKNIPGKGNHEGSHTAYRRQCGLAYHNIAGFKGACTCTYTLYGASFLPLLPLLPFLPFLPFHHHGVYVLPAGCLLPRITVLQTHWIASACAAPSMLQLLPIMGKRKTRLGIDPRFPIPRNRKMAGKCAFGK